MKRRTNLNTSVVMAVFVLVMTRTTFAGPLLFSLQVDLRYEYERWDSVTPVNKWPVHLEVRSQVTIDSVDYFHIQLWNEDNDSAFDDLYVRSTEQALYSYNPAGDDYMYFQKAPVGTKWSFYQEDDSGSGFNYRVIEIVDIVPVTVPYGTFDTAYVHRKYRCVDPDDLSKGQSPYHYQWMVPGVGWVKEVHWWPKQNQIPPLTMELVRIVLPDPQAKIMETLEFFDASVEAGNLVGDGPGDSAEYRLNALRNMLEAASDLIEDGLIQEACQQLRDAYKRCDGQPKPPDFISGEASEELAAMIQDVIDSLGCE